MSSSTETMEERINDFRKNYFWV